MQANRLLPLTMKEATKDPHRQPSPKSVTFNEFLVEITFEGILEEEAKKEQNWYTYSDKKSFERELKDTIKNFKKAQQSAITIDDPSLCLRGLEDHLSPQRYLNRKSRLLEYKTCLVHEQERRYMVGLAHPFGMHEILRSKSQWALENALLVAQSDAHEALQETSRVLSEHQGEEGKATHALVTVEHQISFAATPQEEEDRLILLHPSKKFATTPNFPWGKPKAIAKYVENSTKQVSSSYIVAVQH